MKKSKLFASLFVCLILAGCATDPNNHNKESIDILVMQLCSDDISVSSSAHLKLKSKGTEILSILVLEMNKNKYKSEIEGIEKLNDPKWQKRMKIAGIIQEISGEDFSVYTSTQGWNPDFSFDEINKWWKNYTKESNL